MRSTSSRRVVQRRQRGQSHSGGMMSPIPSWGVASLWALACCSCSAPSTSTSHDPEDGEASPVTIEIDPYRELFIVDPSVVLDSRASSASNGPWSFRRLVAQLAGPGTDPAAFVEAWLRSMRTTSLNGFPLEDRLGVEAFLAAGTSAWPRTPSGGLDLSRSPFRLLAIVNRLDLSERGHGEARFVF